MESWKSSRCARLLAGAGVWGLWQGSASAHSDVLAARMMAGPPGARALSVDLSAAHALVREFSMDSVFSVADTRLAQVLTEDDALEPAHVGRMLRSYASLLGDVAALRSSAAVLPQARVERRGAVTIVHPGTGPVQLPAETQLVLVDLRGLPASAELAGALQRSSTCEAILAAWTTTTSQHV